MSYNNTITLRELFTGNHPLLEQPYSPMTIRFFILQAHYRSTLDFNNEALKGAEKGLLRLMNSADVLNQLRYMENAGDFSQSEDEAVNKLINSLTEYMNDDFNTAMTMASLFDLTSKINAWQNQQAKLAAISSATFERLKTEFSLFVSEILGLKNESAAASDSKMDEVMQLVISLRNEARAKKDFVTSDNLRNDLQKAGIQLKDGKEGTAWEII